MRKGYEVSGASFLSPFVENQKPGATEINRHLNLREREGRIVRTVAVTVLSGLTGKMK